jgi:alanyl-tRNA synthetase
MTVGSVVECRLNWNQRLRRMQNHSGEHVLSGIIHSKFGYENVGFHMGEDFITVDYSGELTAGQVYDIERECNLAVAANVPVTCTFYEKDALDALEYRSKKELQGPVRIVNVQGYDTCACCAPHVYTTGQIGMIKIYTHARHRGGTRLTMLCGMDALDDYNARCANISAISGLLSAKPMEVSRAAAKLWQEHEDLKYKMGGLYRKLLEIKIAALEETEGNLVIFEQDLDMDNLRELINAAKDQCGGMAAGFIGNDEEGYRYIIGSKTVDLRAEGKKINAAIKGKGGGKSEMIQGTATASAAEIRAYFE